MFLKSSHRLLPSLALALGLPWAAAWAGGGDGRLERIATPVGDISLHASPDALAAAYCPDSTCDRLEARPSLGWEVFRALALVYFKEHSGYIYLEDWRPPLAAEKARLNERVAACAGQDFACVLRWGEQAHGLAIYNIRHDGGETHVSRKKL